MSIVTRVMSIVTRMLGLGCVLILIILVLCEAMSSNISVFEALWLFVLQHLSGDLVFHLSGNLTNIF